jgi:hypothetical protein
MGWRSLGYPPSESIEVESRTTRPRDFDQTQEYSPEKDVLKVTMDASFVAKVKELGPWILSAVALLQVWVIAIVRRFRKGFVEIHESDNIQVGYGAPGLSLVLKGTLRVTRQDVFLKRIDAKVTRAKDSATYVLRWANFLSGTRIANSSPNQGLEPVWSFPIKPTDIYRYHVFFTDPSEVAERQGKLDLLAERWGTFVRKKLEEAESAIAAPRALQNPALSEAFFDEFQASPFVRAIAQEIDRAMLWQSGDYRLEMVALCSDPERSFAKSWDFRLTEEDINNLRANTLALLRQRCGLAGNFTFAYPEYRPR